MQSEVRDEPDGSLTLTPVSNPLVIDYMRCQAAELVTNLRVLGVPMTLITAAELLDKVSSDSGFFWSSVMDLIVKIHDRLKDELSLVTVFVLEPAQAQLYDPGTPLSGTNVAAKFPSLAYEIREAGRCLALGRSTAAAFHAIRCLEAAVLAMSRCLCIPDPIKASQRNWGAMLRLVKADIDRRWPTSTNRMDSKRLSWLTNIAPAPHPELIGHRRYCPPGYPTPRQRPERLPLRPGGLRCAHVRVRRGNLQNPPPPRSAPAVAPDSAHQRA